MYIPSPAKLLFQYDDGWDRFIENNHVDEWQLLCVEKMLACSTCAMGVRRYCCSSPECTHSRFFCQTCKSKACSACGLQRYRTMDRPTASYLAGLRMATYHSHHASPALTFLQQ
ncbi:TPA: transposase zinc-binding domain-containing protein [Providencia alcalifaciens]|nr:transposase zinc-binding domain-containing protein [Providencia sp. JUb39]